MLAAADESRDGHGPPWRRVYRSAIYTRRGRKRHVERRVRKQPSVSFFPRDKDGVKAPGGVSCCDGEAVYIVLRLASIYHPRFALPRFLLARGLRFNAVATTPDLLSCFSANEGGPDTWRTPSSGPFNFTSEVSLKNRTIEVSSSDTCFRPPFPFFSYRSSSTVEKSNHSRIFFSTFILTAFFFI